MKLSKRIKIRIKRWLIGDDLVLIRDSIRRHREYCESDVKATKLVAMAQAKRVDDLDENVAKLVEPLCSCSRDIEKLQGIVAKLERDMVLLNSKQNSVMAHAIAICNRLDEGLRLSTQTLRIVRDAQGFPKKRTAKKAKRRKG